MLETGRLLEGKYRIVRLIGQGGMSAVYEGENVRVHRKVAIKVLRPPNEEGASDAIARFEREATAAGHIGSDHILEVFDLGSLEDGERFMVMEYLDGETLGARITRRSRLTPKELVAIGRQALVGLKAAHDAGIVHRDVKPDNLFIVRQKVGHADFVKIIDFGISKFRLTTGDSKMTRTGAVMGTPYYMPPEQARGGAIDPRSDIYSMGVIFYEATTGSVPFEAPTFNELLFRIVLAQPNAPRALVPDLDPAFESLILKAMAREPENRFQSAEEFIGAIDTWSSTGTGVKIPPRASDEEVLQGALPGVTLADRAVDEMATFSTPAPSRARVTPSGLPDAPLTPRSVPPPKATTSTWSQSHPPVVDAGVPKNRLPRWALWAATGTALFLVASIGAWRFGGESSETPANAASAPAETTNRKAPPNETEAVRPPERGTKPSIEPAVAPAASVAGPSAAGAEPTPRAAARSSRAPRAANANAPVKAPRPASPATAPTQPKRRDFGY